MCACFDWKLYSVFITCYCKKLLNANAYLNMPIFTWNARLCKTLKTNWNVNRCRKVFWIKAVMLKSRNTPASHLLRTQSMISLSRYLCLKKHNKNTTLSVCWLCIKTTWFMNFRFRYMLEQHIKSSTMNNMN